MNNSEILYLYDAKMTNPNGDPDEENRPRMDYEREINLVSDIRLKRYIRDYLQEKGENIFVCKLGDKAVTAEGRVAALIDTKEETILKELIDIRMFGATIPVKGDNKSFIGPIQFNWGYSLNKVELLEASITSHFAADSKNTQGTIGKDYRVKYSLIAFSGVISGKRAEHTKLTEEDISLFDNAMRYAIPSLATRSKIGQYPRLYIRLEYKDNETILGDMRNYINYKEKVENVRDITECSIEISKLVEYINENKSRISKLYYYHDKQLELHMNKKQVSFEEAFGGLELIQVK